MQAQQTAATSSATYITPRAIFTVRQFSERNPAFSQAALRNLIFKADTGHSSRGEIPGNGLIEAGAIVRVGRKVLLDEVRFFAWIDQQNGSETTRNLSGGA
jgi:hypothetical protein